MPSNDSSSAWTDWILGYFYKKGKALEFMVETKTLPGKFGEGQYLVDLCWWKEQNEQYWLELILESEWQSAKEEIEQDFYKLVDVKSRLKVWICSWGENQMQARRSELSTIVAKARFRFPEEEYLVLNIPDSQKAEYKDSIIVNGFWMNCFGKPNPLRPFQIHRTS